MSAHALHEGSVEADERGWLKIDPSVIRKIAERTADDAPGTTVVSRTLGSDRGAQARVSGAGDAVDIDLSLALNYPVDVRETVRNIRQRLTSELSRTTGRRVRTMDVTVTALVPETTAAPRVL